MAAYMIVNIDILDASAFKEYQSRFPALMEQFGGRYIVRGGATEQVEGDWEPRRLIVIEFPTIGDARRLVASEEYQALKRIRDRSTRTDFILVEGV